MARAAAAAFFWSYLVFQVVYPTLSWFLPGYDKFTWQMYAGLKPSPDFEVLRTDGSREAVGPPMKVGGKVRILGPSVDQGAVVPPWICGHWPGVEAVIVIDRPSGVEETIPCGSAVR